MGKKDKYEPPSRLDAIFDMQFGDLYVAEFYGKKKGDAAKYHVLKITDVESLDDSNFMVYFDIVDTHTTSRRHHANWPTHYRKVTEEEANHFMGLTPPWQKAVYTNYIKRGLPYPSPFSAKMPKQELREKLVNEEPVEPAPTSSMEQETLETLKVLESQINVLDHIGRPESVELQQVFDKLKVLSEYACSQDMQIRALTKMIKISNDLIRSLTKRLFRPPFPEGRFLLELPEKDMRAFMEQMKKLEEADAAKERKVG